MKECIAMLLAGGQGSRLYALTKKLAKPAVPFGGKYRIIDFPLSNCVNSGIDTVGILTQYQPLLLNEYIGNGQPWDLDRLYGGVHVLPPYQTATGSDWYKGTANAIYQNINFIERYDPEYVLILSGDHIYKMDYGKMLEFHKDSNADCTIAVLEVPWEEASRFGIMTADENNVITKFEEKPKEPKSNLASMGIYIFTWEKLRKYLTEDEADKTSSNDFGKNIIPNMLADQQRLRTPLRATGRTWAPSTACGKPIWTCWTPMFRWMYGTRNGKSIPVPPAVRATTSAPARWLTMRCSPRAARWKAPLQTAFCLQGPVWKRTPWWNPPS